MTTGDRIRVAMLHGPARPDRDGVSDYIGRLVRALRDVDVEIASVPVRPTGDRSPLRWVVAAARAADEVRRLRPDVVHVQFAPSACSPLLAFFGFVHPVKGVRYLIEALPQLRRTHPDLRLLVVGGFTSQALPEPEARAFRAELTDLARRCGLAGAVTFTGHLPPERVSAALHAADVMVLPFTAGVTTKSGALLAALAHGVPTAVTVPEQGDDDLHRSGAVAVIRTRRDTGAVVATVQRLLSDPVLRRRLAERGRALASAYSWPRVAASHRDVYDSLLGHGHG